MQVLNSWKYGSTHVEVGLKENTLCAKVTKDGQETDVSSDWIRGVPHSIQKKGEAMRRFLSSAYPTVNPLSGEGFSITLSQRGLGGAGDLPGVDPQLLPLLEKASNEALKAKGLNIAVFSGNTGIGKSTAINGLLGRTLTYDREKRGYVAENAVTEIGHRAAISHTLMTLVYPDHKFPNTALVPADTGGFFDTRGMTEEVAVSTSMKLTLENAHSVVLVPCFETRLALAERARHLTDFLRTFLHGLAPGHASYPKNFLLLLTKPPHRDDHTDELYTREDAVRSLKEIESDLAQENKPENATRLKDIQFILRENGKYIAIFNPKIDDTRQYIENMLAREMTTPITSPRGKFGVTYGPAGELKLTEMMVAISLYGLSHFDKLKSIDADAKSLAEDLSKLKERITKAQTSLDQASQNLGGSPERAEEAYQQIMSEMDKQVQEGGAKIKELEGKLRSGESGLKEQQDALAQLDKTADQEVEYWSNGDQQQGVVEQRIIPVEKTEMKDVQQEALGVVTFLGMPIGILAAPPRQESVTTVENQVVEEGKEHKKDFSYSGPQATRVVLNPHYGVMNSDNKPYWDREPGSLVGHSQFSIQYETGKGEASDARIAVYTRMGDTPSFAASRSALREQLQSAESSLLHDKYRIGEVRTQIDRAELAKEKKGSLKERLDSFKSKLEEFKEDERRLLEKQAKIESDKTSTQDALRDAEDKFQFLERFLELSNDDRLKAKEPVKKFIEQRAQRQ